MKFKGLLVVCCFVFICACSSKNKDYSENQTGQFIDVKEKNKVVQATKMIVLEKFTADWCPPCKDTAEAYSNLFKNEGLGDHAIMLSYQLDDHIFNSLDEDTQSFFNNGSNEVSTQRNYHGKGVPWVYKNGGYGMSYDERIESYQNGGCPYSDSPSIKNILGTSKSEYQPQPADYKIDMRLNANALTISITHQATVDFNNLEIHVVITEKTHTYDTAPGTNSQVSFSNSVVKHMGSTVVTALSPNDQQEISYDLSQINLPEIVWNYGVYNRQIESFNIVAFIQNKSTNKILNGAIIEVEE